MLSEALNAGLMGLCPASNRPFMLFSIDCSRALQWPRIVLEIKSKPPTQAYRTPASSRMTGLPPSQPALLPPLEVPSTSHPQAFAFAEFPQPGRTSSASRVTHSLLLPTRMYSSFARSIDAECGTLASADCCRWGRRGSKKFYNLTQLNPSGRYNAKVPRGTLF